MTPCLYRSERPVHDEERTETVCLAARAYSLVKKDGHLDEMVEVCSQCPIPEIFAAGTKTCLYLLPMRIFGESEISTMYNCRILYTLNPAFVSTTAETHVPELCPWWFPHPMRKLPLGTEWHTNMAIGLYLGEIELPRRKKLFETISQPGPIWWRRLLSRFL